MLVSHRHRFIFTKTLKTAGTSIESYFEPYCMREGEWKLSHNRFETISEAGIIGVRDLEQPRATWHGHMPAGEIRRLLGETIWNDYFKFTVVRNPFDKVISGFYFSEEIAHHYTPGQRTLQWMKNLVGRGDRIVSIKGSSDVDRFRDWIRKGGAFLDRDKYLIDGAPCVDYFIRYENLEEGVHEVCSRLQIPFEPERIPEFKRGIRPHKLPMAAYYDRATESIIRSTYSWEIERFGYDMP